MDIEYPGPVESALRTTDMMTSNMHSSIHGSDMMNLSGRTGESLGILSVSGPSVNFCSPDRGAGCGAVQMTATSIISLSTTSSTSVPSISSPTRRLDTVTVSSGGKTETGGITRSWIQFMTL